MHIYSRSSLGLSYSIRELVQLGFKSTIDLVFPYRCALCKEPSNQGFCPNCQKLLPWIKSGCLICNRHMNSWGVCGICQNKKPCYAYSIVPFRYDSPISNIIQQLKYSEQLHYAFALGKMLSSQIMASKSNLPEVIIPIPLHQKRIRTRGFNQASEIAKVVSKNTRIPLQQKYLIRSRNTDSQTGLSEKMRNKNMKHAFIVKSTKYNEHVALLDDVITSGATVNSAASALLKSGIAKVSVWAIAKT